MDLTSNISMDDVPSIAESYPAIWQFHPVQSGTRTKSVSQSFSQSSVANSGSDHRLECEDMKTNAGARYALPARSPKLKGRRMHACMHASSSSYFPLRCALQTGLAVSISIRIQRAGNESRQKHGREN
mmetsp:Transcript_3626/g.9740  ORF Transcript_3626/g.9740 Transcript_3626/m.9740 type:complete len:128 (-) Transcript_3626:101-484(-)